MFDDHPIQPNSSGQVPPNLPFGEPEDMFGDAEASPAAPIAPLDTGPSALNAGVLKPKADQGTPQPRIESIPPELDARNPLDQEFSQAPVRREVPQQNPSLHSEEMYKVKEPVLSRGVMTVIISLLIIGVLGGVGWWVYNYVVTPGEGDEGEFTLEKDSSSKENIPSQNQVQTSPIEPEEEVDVPLENSDDVILFGEPIDSDKDGLDDIRETEVGTDPNDWDSDADELSDGNEVVIWKTDPNNPDTGGDTFKDGLEIKGGYNPSGPGRLGRTATSTTSTSE